MSVLLEKICIDPIFDKAKILAGKAGIRRRIVHRVSVFDCPYHKNIAEEGIYLFLVWNNLRLALQKSENL